MSDVNPGAIRINELIRNYSPLRSDETDMTLDCVAERIVMAMRMPVPGGESAIIPEENSAIAITSQINDTGGVDLPYHVDPQKYGIIYMCDEFAPSDDLDGGVMASLTEDKEEEKGQVVEMKTEETSAEFGEGNSGEVEMEENLKEGTLVTPERTTEPVEEAHSEGSSSELEEKKRDGESEEVGEVKSMVGEDLAPNEEVEIRGEWNGDKEGKDKVVWEMKFESLLIEEVAPDESVGAVEMREELNGDKKGNDKEVGEMKFDNQPQGDGDAVVNGEIEEGEILEQEEDEEELTSWSSITELDTTSLLRSVSSLSFGEIISMSDEEEGALTADEIDDEVWGDDMNADEDVLSSIKIEVDVKDNDVQELTSWSSITELDTTSLLRSVSSLSFGEIISMSDEEEGALTADEIDDEVWGDDMNADKDDLSNNEVKVDMKGNNVQDHVTDASIITNVILPDREDTAPQTADKQAKLITLCPKGQGVAESCPARRGFWSRVFGKRKNKKDKKAKKIAAEPETKPKKTSKMAAIIFACCCVEPSDE